MYIDNLEVRNGEVVCKVSDFDSSPERFAKVGKGKPRIDKSSLFPELEELIAARKIEQFEGLKYPDSESRMTAEYVKEFVDISLPSIGGTELERTQFVEEVIRPSVLSLWIEGCGAATIQDKVIHFNVKSNA